MRILFLLMVLFLLPPNLSAQEHYRTLDPSDPIVFAGDHIMYRGEKIELRERSFFLDGHLPQAVADRYPYVFNSLQAAVSALTDGTPDDPMTLYIAPWVYWVDDPDDPAVRKPGPGQRAPFGMEIDCAWLRFFGLNANPAHVVLAGNRGQTHGADGNFTLLNLRGDGLSAENVTFGNYCNVDLEFPLAPQLNRPRRADAIVQAQLVFTNADKAWARNVRFISRLNLCPFAGARRLLFDRCYFECTDDALAGTGVYLDSRFVFYSSKPFYTTHGTGAVFLNCDFEIKTQGRQYFTKVDSPLVLVDCRFTHPTEELRIGWSEAPRPWVRNYQFGVMLNGKPYRIDAEQPEKTVDLTGTTLLQAFRVEHLGEVVYNTYNLLCGEDD
ncbi:MAG: hypothetical protein LUD68_01785 [Rikenellaceae bacterium]|nr:hypothetical protein [Rikenellaceae bacterium]